MCFHFILPRGTKVANGDVSCPKCHAQSDTLVHTLNDCVYGTGLMRERHNAVLKRLSHAAG